MNSEKVTSLVKEAVNYLIEEDLREENGWKSEDIEILGKLQDKNFRVSFDEELEVKFDSNTLKAVDTIIKNKLNDIDQKIKNTDDENRKKFLVMQEIVVKSISREINKLYNY
jgi:hypothetical protein